MFVAHFIMFVLAVGNNRQHVVLVVRTASPALQPASRAREAAIELVHSIAVAVLRNLGLEQAPVDIRIVVLVLERVLVRKFEVVEVVQDTRIEERWAPELERQDNLGKAAAVSEAVASHRSVENLCGRESTHMELCFGRAQESWHSSGVAVVSVDFVVGRHTLEQLSV